MNTKVSSPEMARKAARVLVRVKSSELDKSLAGSVVSQASGQTKKVYVRVPKK